MADKAGSPVYCSGPMFSSADLAQQRSIASTLKRAGYSTYLPQRDGIEVARVMGDINSPRLKPEDMAVVMPIVRKLVFALDIYQLLDRCNAVVFNIDGRVPDDGSVMEASVGWAAALPVVVYKTTPVTMLGGYDNPMLAGLAMRWDDVNNLRDLPAAVSKAVADDAGLGQSTFKPGPHAKRVIALGKKVWSLMPEIREVSRRRSPKAILAGAAEILEEIGPLLPAASGDSGPALT